MSKFEKVRGMHNIPVEETHYWSHVLNFSEKLMKSFSYSKLDYLSLNIQIYLRDLLGAKRIL